MEKVEQRDRDLVEVTRDVNHWVEEQQDKKAKRFEMARTDADFILNHQALEQSQMRLAETIM